MGPRSRFAVRPGGRHRFRAGGGPAGREAGVRTGFWRVLALVGSGLAAAGLAGCGDPQESAVSDLHGAGFGFEVGEFLRAAGEGRLETVRLYTEAGMSVDATDEAGETALYRAAAAGVRPVAEWLVAQGADVHHLNEAGDTILMAASRSGNVEVVRLLLEAGVDPAVKDAEGWTALTQAANAGHAGVIAVLAPVTPRLVDDAFMIAAVNGDPESIDVLLRHGASVYARSPENRTALMYAAVNGHGDIVRLLVRHGANRFALDGDDRVAGELAAEAGFDEIAGYLNEPALPEEAEAEVMLAAQVLEGGGGVPGDGPGVTFVGERGDDRARASGFLQDGAPEAGSPDPAEGGPDAGLAPRLDGAVVAIEPAVPADPGSAAATERPAAPAIPEPMERGARLVQFRERPSPLVLEAVDGGKQRAVVRDLRGGADGGTEKRFEVEPGGRIPGSSLEVVSIQPKWIHSKLSRGKLVDVSRIVVRDVATDERFTMVRGIQAREGAGVAYFTPGDGRVYEARIGDEFSLEGDPADRYRVVDVRPTQVVIQRMETGEAVTVERTGVLSAAR